MYVGVKELTLYTSHYCLVSTHLSHAQINDIVIELSHLFGKHFLLQICSGVFSKGLVLLKCTADVQ